jgi:hypothetical protein
MTAKETLNISSPHPLRPYPYGLLSAADVTYYKAKQDHWARYTAHEFNSDSFALRLLTINDGDVTGGELYEGLANPRYEDYIPFGIEVEDFASTFGLLAHDRLERVKHILESTSGKAVEHELWAGKVAQETGNGNAYFTQSGASAATNVTVAAGGETPRVALARLEGALAQCPTGQHGTIHMTRRMGSLLYDQLDRVDYSARLDASAVSQKGQTLITRLGTPVIIGVGYPGTGPEGAGGAAAVTNTTEWMFATGYVDVHLGEVVAVNEDYAHGVDPSVNTMRAKAARTAAVHFEPCCHYAVRVDYSNVA